VPGFRRLVDPLNAALPLARLLWRTTEDAAAVHALHQLAIATEAPGLVRADPADHFDRIRGRMGQLVGGFQADGQMVAYGVLALGSPVVLALATLLGVDASMLCVLDGSAVHPDCRGQRLHEAVIDERLRRGAALGRQHAAATVAPQNIHSLRGLLRTGLEMRRFAILYGGQPRFVMQRTLAHGPDTSPAPQRDTERSLPITDLLGHQVALASGLVGHDCRQTPQGDWLVDYARPA
jgi:hypothetical protein